MDSGLSVSSLKTEFCNVCGRAKTFPRLRCTISQDSRIPGVGAEFTDATRENRSATRWAGRNWEGIPWRTVRETQHAASETHVANLKPQPYLPQ